MIMVNENKKVFCNPDLKKVTNGLNLTFNLGPLGTSSLHGIDQIQMEQIWTMGVSFYASPLHPLSRVPHNLHHPDSCALQSQPDCRTHWPYRKMEVNTEKHWVVRSRFGEICSCAVRSLTVLLGPDWFLLNYVLENCIRFWHCVLRWSFREEILQPLLHYSLFFNVYG